MCHNTDVAQKEVRKLPTDFSKCPNCGANLDNEPTLGFIEYEPGKGVNVCEKCISNPKCLSETVICDNLLELGWFLPDIELVRKAIKNRKLEEK